MDINGDSKRLVLFERNSYVNESNIKCENVQYVTNYQVEKKLQTDFYSCAVFSFNVLKNCFKTADYENFFLNNSPLEVKESMAQNKLSKESFKDYYVKKLIVDLGEGKKERGINLKAWFKGHSYALKLNPDHLSLLPEDERKLFEEIKSKREAAKNIERTEGLFPDSLDIDLPDNSPKKPNAARVSDSLDPSQTVK